MIMILIHEQNARALPLSMLQLRLAPALPSSLEKNPIYGISYATLYFPLAVPFSDCCWPDVVLRGDDGRGRPPHVPPHINNKPARLCNGLGTVPVRHPDGEGTNNSPSTRSLRWISSSKEDSAGGGADLARRRTVERRSPIGRPRLARPCGRTVAI